MPPRPHAPAVARGAALPRAAGRSLCKVIAVWRRRARAAAAPDPAPSPQHPLPSRAASQAGNGPSTLRPKAPEASRAPAPVPLPPRRVHALRPLLLEEPARRQGAQTRLRVGSLGGS